MRVEVDGEVQLSHFIDKWVNSIKDVSSNWKDVANTFWQIEREQFDSQGHGRWQPLSPRYAVWKAAHYPGQPLLVRSGKLRTAAGGGAGSETQVRPQELTLRIRVGYAGFHQHGAGPLPQRKIVDLRPADETLLMKAFKRSFIQRLMRLRP